VHSRASARNSALSLCTHPSASMPQLHAVAHSKGMMIIPPLLAWDCCREVFLGSPALPPRMARIFAPDDDDWVRVQVREIEVTNDRQLAGTLVCMCVCVCVSAW
jgi:hypothetical protein